MKNKWMLLTLLGLAVLGLVLYFAFSGEFNDLQGRFNRRSVAPDNTPWQFQSQVNKMEDEGTRE